MLLCLECHKLIDSSATRDKYPTELLQEKKQIHEERIRYLTSLRAEQTRVVVFQTRIQQSADGTEPAQTPVVLHRNDLYEAILPDFFPDQQDPSRVALDLPTDESDGHWEQLRQSITRRWERLDTDELPHLSVFCLGKMPAIMHFGRCLGDTRKVRPMNIQQGVPTRWMSNEQVAADFKYEVDYPHVSDAAADVLLLLSLSGEIEPHQYAGQVPEGISVYRITHSHLTDPTHSSTPNADWLVAESQLKEFTRLYRGLLSRISTLR